MNDQISRFLNHAADALDDANFLLLLQERWYLGEGNQVEISCNTLYTLTTTPTLMPSTGE